MKLLITFLISFWLNIQALWAGDRLVGYYYPVPNNVESYKARMRVNAKTNRSSRNSLVKMISNEFLNKSYTPRFTIFTIGPHLEELVIVSMIKDYLDTTYRARALLESLKTIVQRAPLVKETKPGSLLNFFDYMKILGFRKITVSDGDKFSYQIVLR